MDDTLFQDLLDSVEEAGQIQRGEIFPARRFRYVGRVLVEIEEEDRCVWHLQEAAARLTRGLEGGTVQADDVKAIREALRQSQEGFAELLGISVGTLRGWEQGRRRPRGPARMLLHIVARHPEAVLETVQAQAA